MRIDRKPSAQALPSSVPPVFDMHRARTAEGFEHGRRPAEECAELERLASRPSDPPGIHARSE
jgi:hypothetical protein